MNDLLKYCPFCGAEAKLVKRKFKVGFYPSGGTYYVHCKKCLITTQPRTNAESVIEAWNRRMNDAEAHSSACINQEVKQDEKRKRF